MKWLKLRGSGGVGFREARELLDYLAGGSAASDRRTGIWDHPVWSVQSEALYLLYLRSWASAASGEEMGAGGGAGGCWWWLLGLVLGGR